MHTCKKPEHLTQIGRRVKTKHKNEIEPQHSDKDQANKQDVMFIQTSRKEPEQYMNVEQASTVELQLQGLEPEMNINRTEQIGIELQRIEREEKKRHEEIRIVTTKMQTQEEFGKCYIIQDIN